VKTAISLLAFVGLVTFGFQLLVSRSVSGSLFLASLAMMTRVSLRGRKLVFLIAGVAGLLVASRQVPLTPQISSLPTMLAALSLLAINIACLPPAVLLLGVSRRECWMLADPLKRAISPLKCIHLLDSSLEPNRFLRAEVRRTEFRLWRQVDWQYVVRRLSGIVPLIIVDARVESDQLSEEINQIIKSGFHERTLFLCDEQGESRALDSIAIPSDIVLKVLTPERMIPLLRGIGWFCVLHAPVKLMAIITFGLDEHFRERGSPWQ